MKASIKLREDKNPILRAKMPLNVLGFPFRSGIEAGESKELCLSLTTFFKSGPLLKLCYRPNDGLNPFGLVVKTGIGHFGSPIGAPMTMSAEFNVLRNGEPPRFFLHFKPHFGDFSIKQSVNSSSQIDLSSQPSQFSNSVSKIEIDNGEPSENNETPVETAGKLTWTGLFSGEGISDFSTNYNTAVEKLLAGGEVRARTALPVRDRAVVNFRWILKFPANDPTPETPLLRKIPCLVLSKIGIEHVAGNKDISAREFSGDVADDYMTMKPEVDLLQDESASLRKCVEELRSAIGTGESIPAAGLKNAGRHWEVLMKTGTPLGEKKQNKESIPNDGADGESC